MNLHELYFRLRAEDIAYVKFVLESYDGVGIIRTVDRKKAVVVALVVEDFLSTARQLFASLHNDIDIVAISRPEEIGDDWLMKELVIED
ncbi:MAG TPA: DUF4911 domain-containing protein [Candidatus Binatia bacterium]|jgi:hypothetical protein|nr:DUF4911 domain-containing protein [Candidatus Binatia bacterium]